MDVSGPSLRLSPSARAAGKFAAAIALGLGIYLTVELLGRVGFPPIMYLVEFDDRIYARLASPPITRPDLHPVIFVDINDDTLEKLKVPPDSATPRRLLAEIIRNVRPLDAAAIFLDIDLRSPPDDADLAAELRKGGSPVLVPWFFAGSPACLTRRAASAGGQPGLMKLAVPIDAPVIRVHGLFEPGYLGAVKSLCTEYRYGRNDASQSSALPAAMSKAVDIATGRSHSGADDVPVTWRLNAGARVFPEPLKETQATSVPTAFLRIAPSMLDASGIDRNFFKGAIVIIGSTHRGSGDQIRTPLGDMPGAMVHANVALSLQDPGPRPTFWQQRGIDLLSLVVASFATAYFFWRPVFRRSGESAFWRKIVVIVSGLAISLALWLGVSLFVTYTRYHYGSQLGPWRFGLIMGLVSIFIAFMNDLSQPILEQTETTFGRAWDWLFRQARARTPEAASAATPESRSDTGSDHT